MSLLLHPPSGLCLGARAGTSLRRLHIPALTLSTPLGIEAGVGARHHPKPKAAFAGPPRLPEATRTPVGLPRAFGLHTATKGFHTSALAASSSDSACSSTSAAASAAASTKAPAPKPSTALKVEGDLPTGSLLRGAEGAHYNDRMPDAAAPMTEMAQGGWTMMNPIYTAADLAKVEVVCREPVTIGDKTAHGVVKLLRRMFDLFTGYVAKEIPKEVLDKRPLPVAELRAEGKLLSDKDWLLRIILLESIAGVPGMVGGTLRHLRSLRLLRRDGGWIHTLLEEAENERMHLLTFLAVSQPTYLTRALVMAAQGAFYCAFFGTYLVAPKMAHRFVGALEEEAVRTYTHCISDVEAGLVPEWSDKPAPQIAIDYCRLDDSATLLDVIKVVRADEATHRFVNHSLANLDQANDFNPFALAEASPELRGTKPGFTREESAKFAREAQAKLLGREVVDKLD